ncbi:hypothetical protein ACP4OV_009271 [Aristida adscensionis]
MASSPSTPPAKVTAAWRGYTMEQLRTAVTLLVALGLLTFNSGLAIYLSWDDVEAVACLAVSYVVLALLFAWRLGCSDLVLRRDGWLKQPLV